MSLNCYPVYGLMTCLDVCSFQQKRLETEKKEKLRQNEIFRLVAYMCNVQ